MCVFDSNCLTLFFLFSSFNSIAIIRRICIHCIHIAPHLTVYLVWCLHFHIVIQIGFSLRCSCLLFTCLALIITLDRAYLITQHLCNCVVSSAGISSAPVCHSYANFIAFSMFSFPSFFLFVFLAHLLCTSFWLTQSDIVC